MTGESQDTTWQTPKFHFKVKLKSHGEAAIFQEVSGLQTDVDIAEYKHNDQPKFSVAKMPGLQKANNVILKKGILLKGSSFLQWCMATQMNEVVRKTVEIQLTDEHNNLTMTWILSNAWPVQMSFASMVEDGSDIPIENLELKHEGLTIASS